MNETISDGKGSVEQVVLRPGISRRAFVTALALSLALLASFLLSRYSAYRNIQENFYGQVLVPANEAFDFQLVDQDAKPFRLSDMRGKAVLFSFGFTHCPNVCPTTLSDLAKIREGLAAADQKRVQVLFISVDPDRDTPEVMKKYVPYFDESFVGLTGSQTQIAEAAKAYGAFYEVLKPGESRSDYAVNHSAFTYLIAPDGKWKLLYNFDQLRDSEKMVRDIERILSGPA